mmetsp:Transcript_22132/g.56082  ORF Transcript_22132/g.56082 Transcript_22132/m.56082 type:complete len:174 (+) Transcript_22132:187-708(+)
MAETAEWALIARSYELSAPGARKHVEVRQRFVSLIRGRNGQLHCMDSVCYHAGGPLTVGDIEDVNGYECIRCPWHQYPVRLVDGAKLYKKMEMNDLGKLQSVGWEASENRQRVHAVEERQNGVYVLLSSELRIDRHAEETECESDRWAYNASAVQSVLRHCGAGAGKLRHATY